MQRTHAAGHERSRCETACRIPRRQPEDDTRPDDDYAHDQGKRGENRLESRLDARAERKEGDEVGCPSGTAGCDDAGRRPEAAFAPLASARMGADPERRVYTECAHYDGEQDQKRVMGFTNAYQDRAHGRLPESRLSFGC